ncbi:class I SAM-dependent methyltransferase [Burkholderia ambifaria]|uniref:class I SAM-dependent methyltransferase n=1 Tax=Burkholderia ambifaria TaxID=152480 RepID=UPI002FE32DB8
MGFAAAASIVRDGHCVLDLGCGDGRLLPHLAGKFALKESFDIDISPVAIDRFNASIGHRHIHALRVIPNQRATAPAPAHWQTWQRPHRHHAVCRDRTSRSGRS